MRPNEAGRSGIARTFQNVTLFRGMSVLDNIMTGHTPRMRAGFSGRRCGLARRSRKKRHTGAFGVPIHAATVEHIG
jgi:ABC-type branched-subunit amino acid transport system ATPase component